MENACNLIDHFPCVPLLGCNFGLSSFAARHRSSEITSRPNEQSEFRHVFVERKKARSSLVESTETTERLGGRQVTPSPPRRLLARARAPNEAESATKLRTWTLPSGLRNFIKTKTRIWLKPKRANTPKCRSRGECASFAMNQPNGSASERLGATGMSRQSECMRN